MQTKSICSAESTVISQPDSTSYSWPTERCSCFQKSPVDVKMTVKPLSSSSQQRQSDAVFTFIEQQSHFLHNDQQCRDGHYVWSAFRLRASANTKAWQSAVKKIGFFTTRLDYSYTVTVNGWQNDLITTLYKIELLLTWLLRQCWWLATEYGALS